MKRISRIFLLCSIVFFCFSMLIYFLSTKEQNIPPDITPTGEPLSTPTPEVSPTEEIPEPNDTKSILDLLKIAVQPVGKTMYIWGGGWNEEDTAAGIEAVTLGVSDAWEAFALKQDSSYNYKNTRYQIHDGLDCSGYIGWVVYNALETENGKEGYVLSASKMAQNFADRGLGDYIPTSELNQKWLPGDIMSMNGHAWMVVGMCEDGSVLMLHASPPGVIFCGTTLANGNKSEAVILAENVMKTYYPDWYAKYPTCYRDYSYLTTSSAMRWNSETLTDEENIRDMSAEEIIHKIFE